MSIAPIATIQRIPSTQSAALAGRFASEYLHALSPDEAFTAREFFDRFPDCTRFKSVVLEVTLEEFVRRSCAGDQVSPAEIAGQFPLYQTAIARQIEVYQFLEEASELEDADRWPEPGDEFLGLQLHELLGIGAFSKVYRATERGLGDRQVVVKVCRGAGQEPAFLGRLEHPHITPIHWHQVCPESGLSAIVMPYLARTTMADVIDHRNSCARRPDRAAFLAQAIADLHPDIELSFNREPFSGTFADGVLRWARQLADALEYAHQHGICHSDIKPSNVLLTPTGSAVLVDFSMANDLAIDRKTVGGTFPYMAPEQLDAFLAGRDIPVSFATDLFALGVTLYEFLAGRPPFGCPPADSSRRATAEWLLNHQQGEVVSVSRINPHIPDSLSAIVMQCLALEPQRRPSSASALCARLKQETAVSRRLLNGTRRHKRMFSAVCASLAILAALLVMHAMKSPPGYTVDLERAQVAIGAGNYATALKDLNHALEELPEDSEILATALLLRGHALCEDGDLDAAYRDFSGAKNIEPENGLFVAAQAYCEARIALGERMRDLKPERDAQLISARRRFDRAIQLGYGSPEVLYNLAYLDFRRAPTGSPDSVDLLDSRTRNARRLIELEDISQQLNDLDDELAERPNFHVLRIRIEIERAQLETRRIDTSVVDAAAARHANNLPILLEAAGCYARNARSNDPSNADEFARCLDYWLRAVDNGATEDDFRVGLTSFNSQISEDPRFQVPAPGGGGSLPSDLLLDPVKAGIVAPGHTTGN